MRPMGAYKKGWADIVPFKKSPRGRHGSAQHLSNSLLICVSFDLYSNGLMVGS